MSSKEPSALAQALLDHLAAAGEGEDVSLVVDMLESIVLKNNVCVHAFLRYLHGAPRALRAEKAATIQELLGRLGVGRKASDDE